MAKGKTERKIVLNPSPVRKCSLEGCNKKHYGRGYCEFHYYRHRDGTQLDKPHRSKVKRKCSVRGCQEKHVGRGFCMKHYNEQYKRPKKVKVALVNKFSQLEQSKKDKGLCTYTACNNKNGKNIKGYCTLHAFRHRRGIPMNLPRWTRYDKWLKKS